MIESCCLRGNVSLETYTYDLILDPGSTLESGTIHASISWLFWPTLTSPFPPPFSTKFPEFQFFLNINSTTSLCSCHDVVFQMYWWSWHSSLHLRYSTTSLCSCHDVVFQMYWWSWQSSLHLHYSTTSLCSCHDVVFQMYWWSWQSSLHLRYSTASLCSCHDVVFQMYWWSWQSSLHLHYTTTSFCSYHGVVFFLIIWKRIVIEKLSKIT
jgi:hypothetical protein